MLCIFYCSIAPSLVKFFLKFDLFVWKWAGVFCLKREDSVRETHEEQGEWKWQWQVTVRYYSSPLKPLMSSSISFCFFEIMWSIELIWFNSVGDIWFTLTTEVWDAGCGKCPAGCPFGGSLCRIKINFFSIWFSSPQSTSSSHKDCFRTKKNLFNKN